MLCPIARDTDAYLSLPEAPESDPVTSTCRECGATFQGFGESYCSPACVTKAIRADYADRVSRCSSLQSIEATRAAHIAMGRIV